MNPFLNRIRVRWFAGLLAPCLAFSLVKAEDPAVNPNLRKERDLVVTMEGGKEVKAKIPAGEFLGKDGVLTLYLGDEVNLEFQDKGGKLVEPKVEHPERTLTFKMSQKGETVMMSRTGEIQKAVAMDCQ
ncbi:MAG: hypothetical protein JWO82_3219, partial [Akkermansiaceae bacterium]|nr:hypothetical protein [Akkermansiaceae bacterium]